MLELIPSEALCAGELGLLNTITLAYGSVKYIQAPLTATHLSTNRAQRATTSLICLTRLPLTKTRHVASRIFVGVKEQIWGPAVDVTMHYVYRKMIKRCLQNYFFLGGGIIF